MCAGTGPRYPPAPRAVGIEPLMALIIIIIIVIVIIIIINFFRSFFLLAFLTRSEVEVCVDPDNAIGPSCSLKVSGQTIQLRTQFHSFRRTGTLLIMPK